MATGSAHAPVDMVVPVRWFVVLLACFGLAVAAACSESTKPGRSDAASACRLLDEALDRATARADLLNEHAEELAHPAHVGDDGYEPAEWSKFERASLLAGRAAGSNDDFEPLSAALGRLIDAKGSGGVAAVFALNEPIGDAFDECREHKLLSQQ